MTTNAAAATMRPDLRGDSGPDAAAEASALVAEVAVSGATAAAAAGAGATAAEGGTKGARAGRPVLGGGVARRGARPALRPSRHAPATSDAATSPPPPPATDADGKLLLTPDAARALLRECCAQFQAGLVDVLTQSIDGTNDLFEQNKFVTDAEI